MTMTIKTEVMQRSDQFQYDPSSYGSKYRDVLSTRTRNLRRTFEAYSAGRRKKPYFFMTMPNKSNRELDWEISHYSLIQGLLLIHLVSVRGPLLLQDYMIFLLVSALHAAIVLGCLMVFFCSLLFAHGVEGKRAVMADVGGGNSTQG